MRWIVDGMNVIGSRPDGWWKDRHGAMVGLVELLERWAAGSGEQVTVVFEQPPRWPMCERLVEVAYASRPRADSGDDEIVRRVGAHAEPDTVVVTSDRRLAERVRAAGAAVEPARAFRLRIDGASPAEE